MNNISEHKNGCPFGSHRVLEPKGLLPQAAVKLNNDMSSIWSNEILVDVETLNIDSASFHQISESVGGDEALIMKRVKEIVATKGKHQNPVTGSGGVLIGKVAKIGSDIADKVKVKVGDTIVTLVSLSLTPLKIDETLKVRKDMDQVDVKGQAILFEKTVYAKLPEDLPRGIALSVLDVAGAPAQVERLVKKGDKVFILGAGGKSGMLCSYVAKKIVGKEGMVIGNTHSPSSTERLKKLGLCDAVFAADCTKPLEIYQKVKELTGGAMADVAINCVNVEGTEMATILPVRQRGTVYFFSMATSFTRAALGAEGYGFDVDMIIGNGYAENHDNISLDVIRESKELREVFEKLFV